jgi:hypothetical protein
MAGRDRARSPEDLVRGVRYICRVPGTGGLVLEELVFSHMDFYSIDSQVTCATTRIPVFSDVGGGRRTIQAEVLWRADEHRYVQRAVAALGLPLVPRGPGRRPVWRVGLARWDVAALVNLGRTLEGTLDDR